MFGNFVIIGFNPVLETGKVLILYRNFAPFFKFLLD
nr:MAG TPA: Ciliary BBSome complex subunit 1 [Caudoviricetes sp.]